MIPRRTTLAALLFIGNTAAFAAPKPLELRPLQIDTGKLLGVPAPDGQVIAYKGIPYAAPPVEDLRWRAPQPAHKWRHVLLARDFGQHCVQFGGYPDMVFNDPGPSEDCLTLNVWTPADAEPQKQKKSPGLPVMVWIYGGGFTTGGTSENRQDGQFLAHRGVIVVSMNYRLGIFGFFTHPELDTESSTHSSGNYGLMDQAFALAWVRRNIAAFGGDAANITLFGQSAGSQSVSALMASPISKDLFAKAIGQSGSTLGTYHVPERQESEQRNTAWADRTFGSSKLFYLRSLTTDDVVKAATSRTNPPPHFGPVVDGYFLPDSPADIYAAGKQARIPLLAGWTANESRPAPPATADSFTVQAHTQFGPEAMKFLALFPASNDAEAGQSADDFAAAASQGYPTWAWIESHTNTGGEPVYRYLFALASPGDRNHSVAMGAFHSDDIEYVFGTLDSRPRMAIRPADRALSDLMQQYWTNFARTGDPNAPGLPQWPAYNPTTSYQVMHLDAAPAATPDTLRPRYLFLDGIWSSGNSPQP